MTHNPTPNPLDNSVTESGTEAQLAQLKQQLDAQNTALAETMSLLEEVGSTPLPIDPEFFEAFEELTEKNSNAPSPPMAGFRC